MTQSEESKMRIVSDNIARLLQARNWTWSTLASEAGVSQPTISHIKRAKIDPGFLKMTDIAAALGTSLDWLATPHEQKPHDNKLKNNSL